MRRGALTWPPGTTLGGEPCCNAAWRPAPPEGADYEFRDLPVRVFDLMKALETDIVETSVEHRRRDGRNERSTRPVWQRVRCAKGHHVQVRYYPPKWS